VKIALVIVCSLFLVWGQTMALSVPVAEASAVLKGCGCGGKMSCCRHAPSPLAATTPVNSQNLNLSFAPALGGLFLASAGNLQFFPVVSPSLSVGATPIFARDCARLI